MPPDWGWALLLIVIHFPLPKFSRVPRQQKKTKEATRDFYLSTSKPVSKSFNNIHLPHSFLRPLSLSPINHQTMSCPPNSFAYNGTRCSCNPGHLYNATASACQPLRVLGSEWVSSSGVDYSLSFPETVFSFESIKRFTQSQAVFLEATLVLLLLWLAFCLFVRLGRLGDGRTVWFQIRWWISRLDVCFATRHWLDDQKVVTKRKTELGGAFSMASWILFIGLFAALLFQTISKRRVEVHNVRATNAPDLLSFANDMEFNITTVSNMSCSHLRDIGSLVIGNPGFIDYRVAPLSSFANYSCLNTTMGPTMVLKCENCQILRDYSYVSWQFVDLPNSPAAAVGFQFNLSAKNHAGRKKHLSFVSGMVKNTSSSEDKPVTYRGAVPNILKFNLFPRIYHNMHDLKLIQPLFHEFLPGSYYSEISQLQTSLQSPNSNGLVNVTLYVNFLSAYVVEVNNQNLLGPVGFLAELGGLYCISIGIFFYFLVQCEYRIKKLRNEDSMMRKIRSQRKAQDRWDKLRKYVRYTWGKTLDDDDRNVSKETCFTTLMIESLPKNGSSVKGRRRNRTNNFSINKNVNLPSEKKAVKEQIQIQVAQSCVDKSPSYKEGMPSDSRGKPVLESDRAVSNEKHEHNASHEGDLPETQAISTNLDSLLPPPPTLELKGGSEISMSDIKKNFESLYDYNVMLREQLAAAQCMLRSLTTEASSSGEKRER